jgi:hypothetical protein
LETNNATLSITPQKQLTKAPQKLGFGTFDKYLL